MAGSAHSTLCPAANLLLDFSRDGANVKSWAGLGWAGLGWAGLGSISYSTFYCAAPAGPRTTPCTTPRLSGIADTCQQLELWCRPAGGQICRPNMLRCPNNVTSYVTVTISLQYSLGRSCLIGPRMRTLPSCSLQDTEPVSTQHSNVVF